MHGGGGLRQKLIFSDGSEGHYQHQQAYASTPNHTLPTVSLALSPFLSCLCSSVAFSLSFLYPFPTALPAKTVSSFLIILLPLSFLLFVSSLSSL